MGDESDKILQGFAERDLNNGTPDGHERSS